MDNVVTERIDLIEDVSNYSFFDTSNCLASYIRKGQEYVLGDEPAIETVRQTIHRARSSSGKNITEVSTEDGLLRLTQKKEVEELGIRYKVELVNSKPDNEIFETDACVIEITEISEDRGREHDPINFRDYKTMGVAVGVKAAAGSAEYYSLEYLKARYDIAHIEDNDFVVVQSLEEGKKRLEQFRLAGTKVKAVDLETTGTKLGMNEPDIITGIVLSYSEAEGTYYPFRQDACSYNLPRSFMAEILNAVNSQPEDVVILAHNGKFEKQGFWKERPCYLRNSPYVSNYDDVALLEELQSGYDLRLDADTYLLSVLCDPRQLRGLHTLKGLVYRITGQFYLELDNIFKNPRDIKFNVLPPEIIRYYACPDTANTIKVYNALKDKLPKDEQGIADLEYRLVGVKAINEFYGMRIDQELLVKNLENEEYKVKMLGNMFREICHTTKNINSADVRRDIFYNQLRCPVEVRTPKGLPSTSTIALQRILELGTIRDYDESKVPGDIVDLDGNVLIEGKELISNKYPSLVILDTYAKASKELGAYKRIQRTSYGGRVSFYINQVGAGSGRQTSDAHQYSNGMKQLVLSDSSDHFLWSADYKQMELRILAYLAQQKDLIEMESDPNIDVHRAITSIITGKEVWAISDAERKKNKTVNFGMVYLMSEYGLAKKLHGPAYSEEELLEAVNAITDFYNSLPRIKMFVKQNEMLVKRDGYICTKMGRRRMFPQLLDPSLSAKEASSFIRAANNTPVQGFGADILKVVETNIQAYIKKMGWDALVECDGIMLPKVRQMLSIHDEVLVSSHKSIPIEEVIKMFKVCMEITIENAPPFFSAPALIDNWYAGKNSAYEIDLPFRDKIIEAWDRDKTSLLHVGTYLEDLNRFRSARLNEYMGELVSKYKTVDEVSGHVRHPELTHTLIEVYLGGEGKKYSQLDAIHEATARYMEGRKPETEQYIKEKAEEGLEEAEEIEVIRSYSDFEKVVHVDDKGELIVEEPDGFEEDAEEGIDAIEGTHEREVCRPRSYVQFTLQEALIDLSSYGSLVQAEPANQEISTLHNEKAYYNVVYLFKGKFLRSKIFVDYKDKQKIEEILKRESEVNSIARKC